MPASPAPVRHFALTWALDVEHGGMTSALLRRSRMFAQGLGTPVTILTFDPDRDYLRIGRALRARGLVGPGVDVLNLWDWLIAGSGDEPGAARRMRHRFSADGTRLLRIDHLRADGSLAISDERDAPTRGGRRVRRYGTDGSIVREWRTAWALYAHWLDSLREGERAVMIADSKPVARFLTTYRRRDVLTVHVMHGSHLDADGHDFSAVRRPVIERLDDLDLVVLLTRQQRSDLEGRIGPRANVHVIPNLVDPPTGSTSAAPRQGGVVLASLVRRKRVDHAVRATLRARKLGAPATLDVYGDGPARPAVQAQAGTTAAVRLHGFRPGAAQALRDRSYLLLTSTSEGSPLCVLEALAAGCLPIAYDVRFGPGEVIRDGVNGFLVPPGDVEAMAERIVQLHALPEPAVRQMRRAAVATVEGFGEDVVLATWRRELRAAWHRKTGVIPRLRRRLRRRFARAA